MLFKKFLSSISLVLCFVASAHCGLELVRKHSVTIPGKLTVHSISGIFCDNNKSFILAYYASTLPYEHGGVAKSEQDIYITRGTPDNWQAFKVATAAQVGLADCACFDPVLYQTNGKIYLFYRVGTDPRHYRAGFLKISCDNGENWSNPIKLPENIFGPAKCKPIISQDGKDLICGASIQKEAGRDANNKALQVGWVSVDILKNFAMDINFAIPSSWETGEQIAYQFKDAGSVVIQPAIWQACSNLQILHMLCRANTGKLVYSRSTDFGKTWENAVDSELLSNYSAIDILKTAGDRVFMAWNPLPNPLRNKLVVSELVGNDPTANISWKESLVLEYDAANQKSEYCFPSIISCDQDETRLFIAYGIDRKELILAEVAIS